MDCVGFYVRTLSGSSSSNTPDWTRKNKIVLEILPNLQHEKMHKHIYAGKRTIMSRGPSLHYAEWLYFTCVIIIMRNYTNSGNSGRPGCLATVFLSFLWKAIRKFIGKFCLEMTSQTFQHESISLTKHTTSPCFLQCLTTYMVFAIQEMTYANVCIFSRSMKCLANHSRVLGPGECFCLGVRPHEVCLKSALF